MRRKQRPQTFGAFILRLIVLMLASRSRGASSAILDAVGTLGRIRAFSSTKSAAARRGVIGCAHHDDIGRRRLFQHEEINAPRSRRIAAFHRPSFLSLPAMQKLRGGGGIARNNSTSTRNNDQRSWRKAYIAVGSNLGDRYRNIADALLALEANSDNAIRIVRTSYLRMTAPMYVTDQPAFLNGAVEIETTFSPLELLRAIKKVECAQGRDVGPDSTALRFGPRPVDLDVLLFDGYEVAKPDGTAANTLGDNEATACSLVMKTEELEVPHPRMAEREFVLSPMIDLERRDGRITHPVSNKTMAELLNSLLRSKINNRTTAGDGGKRDEAVRVLPLPRGRMLLFNQTIIMGILNITPDSFSDGGKYSNSTESAATQARRMIEDGADIIDVGGESTRPGAEEMAIPAELERIIPVIERIREHFDIPISIDTRHSAVARAAIAAGADIVNDVSGGTHDPDMLPCVASLGVPMVIMHMRGTPKTMQSLTNYDDDRGDPGGDSGGGVVPGVARELLRRSEAAEAAGVPRWIQVVDPGIGFAKDLNGNLSLLRGADALRRRCDGLPFLFGPSRKGFIGKVAGEADPGGRDPGTVAACLACLQGVGGADGEACTVLRVHNVKAVKQAVLVYEAIRSAN